MNKTELSVQNLMDEIGVYNKTLNNYLDTFNIDYKSPKYLLNPKVFDLRNYHLITKSFYDFIINQKTRISEYEQDYYKSKSVKYISNKIDATFDEVLLYLNNLDLGNSISLNSSRHVFNAYIFINNVKYPIGNIICGSNIGFKKGAFSVKMNQSIISLYKNKKLFTENIKLSHLSSYEIYKGLNKMKLGHSNN